MMLYDVPRDTRVRIVESHPPPPGGRSNVIGQEVLFKRLDGMYSLCVDDKGNILHLKAWTEVEFV